MCAPVMNKLKLNFSLFMFEKKWLKHLNTVIMGLLSTCIWFVINRALIIVFTFTWFKSKVPENFSLEKYIFFI